MRWTYRSCSTTPKPRTPPPAPRARELAARMADTWIAFARHGRPDNPAIPEWPAYTQAERITMVFDDECRITRDPDRDARVLWTRLVKG